MNSYFFSQVKTSLKNKTVIQILEKYSKEKQQQIYILDKPLSEKKYTYNHDGLIILSPKHKIIFLNYDNNNTFDDFVDDVIEDIGIISDRFLYRDLIGRPKVWRENLVVKVDNITDPKSIFTEQEIDDPKSIKTIDLLISLFIGSINNIERIKEDIPETLLDKVKQKIQLFDGDQTRFIYENPNKKVITIQGLSGTGKTELLLHKLKDIYISDENSKIFFTCHNKILSDNLKKRIPDFFNFMKVQEQIKWNERLWCTHAWGSRQNPNSGVYSYICSFYNIPFIQYNVSNTFEKVCEVAYTLIKEKFEEEGNNIYALTHIIVDESQDFNDSFFKLCELVTEKNVYIAGDIFQSIFDEDISKEIKPDFLLGRCYRTDPKTLMFAHGLGMGLFEPEKLRWLDKEEWEGCGYNVKKKDNKFILKREPVRRFEDLDDNFKSIEIVELDSKFSEKIIDIIADLKNENPTLTPDDIGIILLDRDKGIYELANYIERDIQEKFGWKVNKAYETKEKQHDSILISNRNNVKGLEFPFVICVTKGMKKTHSYRNSLYTMLTRSFIKSFLLTLPRELTEDMKKGLHEIINTKQMAIKEPTDEEKQKIKTRFINEKQKKHSLYERVESIFNKLQIDIRFYELISNMLTQMNITDSDDETLESFIKDNMKYLK
ncbi:DEAD/DEAH box helicase [Riemerella anatipestifer]|uniref:DEAD/DEAH box helicase n=1 Tax=Riemerella anatipestifer TaxID=34085 RepID=UPI00069CBA98|nr:ATP-binding domain-containing protein [Riemerella anatipestifer]